MKITSPAFKENQPIPVRYTCDGNNINPPLIFEDLPKQAKSLTLVVDDPDAPVGIWTHWVLYDIPPNVKEIKENSSAGLEGLTSSGNHGYGGPCPPSGTHHYRFKLFALDKTLGMAGFPDRKTVEAAMTGHIILQSNLIGLYSRK